MLKPGLIHSSRSNIFESILTHGMDINYADWSNSGTFDFVAEGLDTIEDLLTEREALVEHGTHESIIFISIKKNDFDPGLQGWENGITKIVKSSWMGTYEQEWIHPSISQ